MLNVVITTVVQHYNDLLTKEKAGIKPVSCLFVCLKLLIVCLVYSLRDWRPTKKGVADECRCAARRQRIGDCCQAQHTFTSKWLKNYSISTRVHCHHCQTMSKVQSASQFVSFCWSNRRWIWTRVSDKDRDSHKMLVDSVSERDTHDVDETYTAWVDPVRHKQPVACEVAVERQTCSESQSKSK